MHDRTVAAFLFGDPLLVSETFRKIEGMFTDEDGEVISSSTLDDAIEELMNPPFFGSKLVLLDTSEVTTKAKSMERIGEIAEDIPEPCMLVVSGGGLSSGVKKAIKAVGEPTYRLFDFSKSPDFKSAVSFVKKRVADAGGKIATDAADGLVSMVGLSFGALAQEIDKIMVVSDDITLAHVTELAFPVEHAEHYSLYSYLGRADAVNAILEARAMVNAYGYGRVDAAIFNLICTALRGVTTGYEECVDVKGHRLTEDLWWPNGKKKGNPMPSSFMKKMAGMIGKRHGEKGVKSIMSFACDSPADIRLFPKSRHVLFIEMKILALCGRDGSPEIIGGKPE